MSAVAEPVITPDILHQAMDYVAYRQLIDSLLEQGKTTGDNHSEAMLEYTRMNVHRMNRLDQNTVLRPSLLASLGGLERKQVWLVITEAWCGDAAQNIPQLAQMAAATEKVSLRLVLRDEHPSLMDRYLTNGTRSIPKVIILDAESLEELAVWGPRPVPAQQLLAEWKANPTQPKEQFMANLHLWYARNKSQALMDEMEAILSSI